MDRIVIILYILAGTECCKDFVFKLNYAKDCPGYDNIIKHINSTAFLKANCEMSISSCSYIQPFKTGKMNFKLLDAAFPINEVKNFDICDRKKKSLEILRGFLIGFGIPNVCNINQNQTFCHNDGSFIKIPLTLLQMITQLKKNPTRVNIMIDHDNGKSCFDAQYEVLKK